MNKITFKDKDYPDFQAHGNAARWIKPFSEYYCKGKGVDVGCSKMEWRFSDAIPVDPSLNNYNAMDLPLRIGGWDYIHSSHMLEHFAGNWMDCLDYWLENIRIGGILFLYLPHKSQEYWLPENNRKHIHSFTGEEITAYLGSLGHDVFCSGVDLNHSFVVVCEKKETADKNVKVGDVVSKWADLPFQKTEIYPCSAILTASFKCQVCEEPFQLGESKYSDRYHDPVPGDYIACPNCNTFYTFKGDLLSLYKPNIFTSKLIRL